MKRITSFVVLLIICNVLVADFVYGWGFRSHRNMHEVAIEGMPLPVRAFFEKYNEFLIEESVAPDVRRRDDPTEGPNHYVNLDRFGEYPFDDFPVLYEDAIAKFDADTLFSYGLAVWRVHDWFDSLTVAMTKKDVDSILRFAADLGHYIGDLHMPLHTTSNYDGQLTGQRGVHRRFETDLPERYDSLFSWNIPEAREIDDPYNYTFEFVLESYRLIDDLYDADMVAREGIPEDNLYTIEQRNNRRLFIYHDTYYEQFHNELDGMVENRLTLAAQRIRDFWHTAWVKAGKPELDWSES